MNALSKKHYYDVIRSGQEDTILESDLSKVDCVAGDTLTSEVGCYVRAHLKSDAVQTHWSRNIKNFRNESTFTSDVEGSKMTLDSLDSPNLRAQSSIHCSRSYEDVAVIRKRSFQATSARNNQISLLKGGIKAPTFLVERAVECVQFSVETKQKGLPLETKATETENLKDDVCIQCAPKTRICKCDRYQFIPCKRGLAACRTFSLGTPESRRLQNEQCKTKLIGGCRVPVCKNNKSRF